MFLYGSFGLIVAAVIWWSCHKTPADHPRCNAAEVELITGDPRVSVTTTGKVSGVPLLPLIKSVSMWLCCLTQIFTNIGWAFLMLLAPRYFTNEHQLSIETVGLLSAIPPIAGGLGMFSGGGVTDRLVGIVGLRWGRVLPITVSRFVAMTAYIVCLFNPGPLLAVVMFACVAFFTGIGTPATWAFNQDVGGKYVGSVLGWGNMWGNFGAAVTAPLLIWVAGSPERWEFVFATCAAAFFLSGIVALGINATIPIVVEDEEAIDT
jgi:nitrate/nitrite transporter NarK